VDLICDSAAEVCASQSLALPPLSLEMLGLTDTLRQWFLQERALVRYPHPFFRNGFPGKSILPIVSENYEKLEEILLQYCDSSARLDARKSWT
jgi:hypothetical protein